MEIKNTKISTVLRVISLSLFTTLIYYLIVCFIAFDIMYIKQLINNLKESGMNRICFLVILALKITFDIGIYSCIKDIKTKQ